VTAARKRGVPNPALAAGLRELRQGSRAQPHRDRTRYTRKGKAGRWAG